MHTHRVLVLRSHETVYCKLAEGCGQPTSFAHHLGTVPATYTPHQTTPHPAQSLPLLSPRPHLSLVQSVGWMRVVQERSLRRLAALRVVGGVLREGIVRLGPELIVREQILKGWGGRSVSVVRGSALGVLCGLCVK